MNLCICHRENLLIDTGKRRKMRWSSPFGHLHAVPHYFSLGRNEAKRDDGCGARPVAHPLTLERAIMQVLPNKRRHNRANAEPQGQLLRQTLDADRHVGHPFETSAAFACFAYRLTSAV